MKRVVSIIVFILLAYPVYSIYGGETQTIFNGECSELIVNISIDPSQDEGEYNLTPNCVRLSMGLLQCDCFDNKTTLNLTPAINSVGNYTITIAQYILRDNETDEPIIYNTTNPTDENITTTITLPNNITIERTIPPNKELIYVETKEDYIIIPEADVVFNSLSTDSENINIEATSNGTKCFDIYTDKGSPYSITINGNTISFFYDNNLIHFCTTFSTKNIVVTWISPTISVSKEEGGGGGGSAFAVHLTENKQFKSVLVKNVNSYFWINSKKHTMKMTDVKDNWAKIEIKSEPIIIELNVNETKTVEIDNETLQIYLEKIKNKVAFIYLTKIEKPEVIVISEPDCLTCQEVYEEHYADIFVKEEKNWNRVCDYQGVDDEGYWIYDRDKCYEVEEEEIEEIPEEEFEEPDLEEISEPEEKKTSGWLIAGVIIVIISAVSLIIYMAKKKKEKD